MRRCSFMLIHIHESLKRSVDRRREKEGNGDGHDEEERYEGEHDRGEGDGDDNGEKDQEDPMQCPQHHPQVMCEGLFTITVTNITISDISYIITIIVIINIIISSAAAAAAAANININFLLHYILPYGRHENVLLHTVFKTAVSSFTQETALCCFVWKA